MYVYDFLKIASHTSTFKQEELPGSAFSSLLLTRPHVLQLASAGESPSLKASVLFSCQFVWLLSVLCGAEVASGFVYDRPKRSGEDGTSARTECE